MASLRVLLALLVAVAAASARHHEAPSGPKHHYHHHQDQALTATLSALDAHLREVETLGATSDAVDAALAKLKKLVEQIKEKVAHAEDDVIAALDNLSMEMVRKVDAMIKRITNVDLQLTDKWAAFEENAGQCSETLKNEVNDIIQDIKTSAETCADTEIKEVEIMGVELLEVADMLENVYHETIEAIKACEKPADEDKPAEDDKPADDSSASADSGSHESGSHESDDKPAVRGIPDIWNKGKCISKELAHVFGEVKTLPKLVYEISQAVSHLISKSTREKVRNCAAKAVAGKQDQLRKHTAELAYCMIAGSETTTAAAEPAEPAQPAEQ